jgi:cytidylate kinase
VTSAPPGFVVAIDGPAASGKSTTARLAALRLGFRYLDTGAMYRAVTWKALAAGADPADGRALAALAASVRLELVPGPAGERLLADGDDVTERIREPAVTRAVSLVASVPAVRRALVPLQRALARGGPAVVEGRDIGTVVFPDAAVKIFLVASLEERARRRRLELGERAGSLAELAEEIRRRDALDSERDDSPLRPAPDAVPLDTTGLAIEDVVAEIVRIVRAALGEAPAAGAP